MTINAITAPDGSLTASKIVEDTSNSQHRLDQATTSSSGVNTFSVYLKQGERTTAWLRIGLNGCYVDLTDGSISNVASNIIASSTELANDWYRVSITKTNASANETVRINIQTGDYTGDGTSGIYVWSAQYEQGLVSTDVITTTTSSVTVGITDDLPRVDYSGGGCPSLLLEPSRTQLLPYSEYFGIDWNFQQLSVTSNVITSPEGVINASKLVEDSSNNRHIMYDPLSSSSGTTYTFSIFAKSAERSFLTMRLDSDTPVINTWFNLSDGSIGTSQGGSPTIKDMGNGWYRCSVQYTSTGGIIYSVAGVAITDGNLNYQGNGTSGIYIYGAMLEAGSYSTSYIPSYGTSTSRSADSCSLTNASNLFNNDTAVWLIDIERMGIDSTDIGDSLTLKDGSNVRQITLWFDAPTEQIRFRDGKNSFTTIGSSGGVIGTPAGERKKIALKIDGTTLKVFADGVQKGSNYTRPTAFDFTKMDMTGIGYKIKNVQFYTTALTDAQVIELTK